MKFKKTTNLFFKSETFIVLIVFAAGLLLRLILIGSKSFWLDEAWSVMIAKSANIADILTGSADEMHPPAYYLFLRWWLQFGDTEAWTRLPSAIFGAFAIPLVYLVGREIHSSGTGISAALFAASAPILVWYSQEARSYSVLIIISLLAILLLIQALKSSRPWLLIPYAFSVALLLYTHYEGIWNIFLSLIVLVVFGARNELSNRTVMGWVLSVLAAIALYLPWLGTEGARSFISRLTSAEIYPARFMSAQFGISTTTAYWIIIVTLTILGLTSLFAVKKLSEDEKLWNDLWESDRIRVLALLILVTFILFSVFPRAYSVKRFIVIFVPYGILVLARLIPFRMPYKKLISMIVAFSVILSLVNVIWIPKDDWRGATAIIKQGLAPGDRVWLLSDYLRAPFFYYDRGDFDWVAVSPGMTDEELQRLANSSSRIWLVYQPIDLKIIDPEKRVSAWLEKHSTLVESYHLYRAEIKIWELDP